MNPITDDVVCSLMEGLEQREKNDLAEKGRHKRKKPGAAKRFLSLSKMRKASNQGMPPMNAAHS